MLDLETLDTSPTSAIISIGAVEFDRTTCFKDKGFYKVVDLQSSFDCGLTISASTIAWWMKQSDAAREVFRQPGNHIGNVLFKFSQWLPIDSKIWGNGADFDNAIMQNVYRKTQAKQPWKFWDNRCYRTIAAKYPHIPRVQQGTHHNALDDAISQAEHLIQIEPTAII